ncbi:MAG: hypothetical protein U1F43_17980 [Myxococcota bacterium]
MRPALPLLVLALSAGCAGSTPELAFSDPESLAASFDLYAGAHQGDVELSRTVKVVVDTAVRPGDAESRFDVAVAIARYTASDAPVSFVVLAPPDAVATTVAGRVGATMVKPLSQERAFAPAMRAVDPGQLGWRVSFAGPPVGQTLEAIVRFTVPGTLASDAQWLTSAPSAGELLLRYDLPGDAVGSFQVVGSELRPVVTKQNGRVVIALFVKDAGRQPANAYARFTTTRASPKGYDQHWADSWAAATSDYVARLVKASDGLDGGYAAPFAATGPDKVGDIFAWVQGRPWTQEALGSSWSDARPLKGPLEQNALREADRVHLLHWLLREAGVPHRFAMARAATYPAVAAAFPVPGAFHTALIQAGGQWLDPGCPECKPGQVRASLAGGQAILLPVPEGAAPELSTLPAAAARETTAP